MNALLILTTIFSGIAAMGTIINIFLLSGSKRKPAVKEDIDDEEPKPDIVEQYHQMYGDK